MQYEGTVIRPPSEAHSIIFQVTIGCSHNRCAFCGAYRDKRFRIRDNTEILQDIDYAAKYCRRQKTVFLADGDALVIPHARMLNLFQSIRKNLPWVRRISLYGNCRDILARSGQQLAELKNLGLDRIYMGLESGHDPTLTAIRKGATAEEMIIAGRRVRKAGIFLSVSCLLGVAGSIAADSIAHAKATAMALNRMRPSQIAILTLMLLENTPLADMARQGRFSLPGRQQLFLELRTLIAGLERFRAQVQANHASNYFSLNGRLPKDKEKFLALVDQALTGEIQCKPEFLRVL